MRHRLFSIETLRFIIVWSVDLLRGRRFVDKNWDGKYPFAQKPATEATVELLIKIKFNSNSAS